MPPSKQRFLVSNEPQEDGIARAVDRQKLYEIRMVATGIYY